MATTMTVAGFANDDGKLEDRIALVKGVLIARNLDPSPYDFVDGAAGMFEVEIKDVSSTDVGPFTRALQRLTIVEGTPPRVLKVTPETNMTGC